MAPLFMKEISLTLKIGAATAQEFNCHVRSAVLEATPGDVVSYQTLCATGGMSQQAAATYVLHLIGVQDWASATTSLARYLDANVGSTATFYFNAHAAAVATSTTPAKTGSCVLAPPNYGGERDAWAEYDVSLPVSGIPAISLTFLAYEALLAGGDVAAAEERGLADPAADDEARAAWEAAQPVAA